MKASKGYRQVTTHVPAVNVVMELGEARALLDSLSDQRARGTISPEPDALRQSLLGVVDIR